MKADAIIRKISIIISVNRVSGDPAIAASAITPVIEPESSVSKTGIIGYLKWQVICCIM